LTSTGSLFQYLYEIPQGTFFVAANNLHYILCFPYSKYQFPAVLQVIYYPQRTTLMLSTFVAHTKNWLLISLDFTKPVTKYIYSVRRDPRHDVNWEPVAQKNLETLESVWKILLYPIILYHVKRRKKLQIKYNSFPNSAYRISTEVLKTFTLYYCKGLHCSIYSSITWVAGKGF